MALQDLPPYGSNPYAQSGENPYDPSDPRYAQFQLSYLLPQLYSEANRNANAKGALYSGGTAADTQQAASSLAYQLAQNQSAQALQEKELLEQQAFQAQQQAQQNQAQASMAAKAAKAQEVGSAMQGGLGALGTVGGLYGMSKLGLLGGAAAPEYSGLASDIAATNAANQGALAAGAAGHVGVAAPELASYTGPEAFAAGATPAFYDPMAVEGAGMSSAPMATAASTAPAATGLGAAGAGTLLGAAGLGGLGAYGGYQLGGGDNSNARWGAGLGGLGGALGGAELGATYGSSLGLPGILGGAAIGGFAGSALGKQLGNFFGKVF